MGHIYFDARTTYWLRERKPTASAMVFATRRRLRYIISPPSKEEELVADIALIVTAVGVLGVVLGLRQNYRERLRQFETRYVERYWSLLDKLSIDALSGASPEKIIEDDNRTIRGYILLCEDELEMREYGYIADNTYKLWADGIQSQFKQPMFAEIWNDVVKEAEKHRTFPYIHLRQLLDKECEAGYDPLDLKIPRWRRRLRGLAGLSGV
jgi:hypothetical protein